MTKTVKKIPRINVTIGFDMLERLSEIREITGLASDTEAARYLMSRGIENLTPQLNSHRMLKRLEAQYSPQEMLPLMAAFEKQNGKALEDE